jgi:hypothetical protein
MMEMDEEEGVEEQVGNGRPKVVVEINPKPVWQQKAEAGKKEAKPIMFRDKVLFQKGGAGGPGRPKESVDKITIKGREFFVRILNDPRYRAKLKDHLIKNAGKGTPMEIRAWDYVSGKPKDVIEFKGDLSKLTDQELVEFERLVQRVS